MSWCYLGFPSIRGGVKKNTRYHSIQYCYIFPCFDLILFPIIVLKVIKFSTASCLWLNWIIICYVIFSCFHIRHFLENTPLEWRLLTKWFLECTCISSFCNSYRRVHRIFEKNLNYPVEVFQIVYIGTKFPFVLLANIPGSIRTKLCAFAI